MLEAKHKRGCKAPSMGLRLVCLGDHDTGETATEFYCQTCGASSGKAMRFAGMSRTDPDIPSFKIENINQA